MYNYRAYGEPYPFSYLNRGQLNTSSMPPVNMTSPTFGVTSPALPMARGGRLSLREMGQRLRSEGRHGDTILAHINPHEAQILRQRGGAGTRNPATGLPEFLNYQSDVTSSLSNEFGKIPIIGGVANGFWKLFDPAGFAQDQAWQQQYNYNAAQQAYANSPEGKSAAANYAADNQNSYNQAMNQQGYGVNPNEHLGAGEMRKRLGLMNNTGGNVDSQDIQHYQQLQQEQALNQALPSYGQVQAQNVQAQGTQDQGSLNEGNQQQDDGQSFPSYAQGGSTDQYPHFSIGGTLSDIASYVPTPTGQIASALLNFLPFAKGGYASLSDMAQRLQAHGRYGDTMLAHINPEEARMLKARGGSGTINPATGLPEFVSDTFWPEIRRQAAADQAALPEQGPEAMSFPEASFKFRQENPKDLNPDQSQEDYTKKHDSAIYNMMHPYYNPAGDAYAEPRRRNMPTEAHPTMVPMSQYEPLLQQIKEKEPTLSDIDLLIEAIKQAPERLGLFPPQYHPLFSKVHEEYRDKKFPRRGTSRFLDFARTPSLGFRSGEDIGRADRGSTRHFARGGSPTFNPATGLPEFKRGGEGDGVGAPSREYGYSSSYGSSSDAPNYTASDRAALNSLLTEGSGSSSGGGSSSYSAADRQALESLLAEPKSHSDTIKESAQFVAPFVGSALGGPGGAVLGSMMGGGKERYASPMIRTLIDIVGNAIMPGFPLMHALGLGLQDIQDSVGGGIPFQHEEGGPERDDYDSSSLTNLMKNKPIERPSSPHHHQSYGPAGPSLPSRSYNRIPWQHAYYAQGGRIHPHDLYQEAQHLQSKGRHGDTILAHINPEEAHLLKQMGGSGTRNPATGLPEYGKWNEGMRILAPVAGAMLGSSYGPVGSLVGASLGGGIGGLMTGRSDPMKSVLEGGGIAAALNLPDLMKSFGFGGGQNRTGLSTLFGGTGAGQSAQGQAAQAAVSSQGTQTGAAASNAGGFGGILSGLFGGGNSGGQGSINPLTALALVTSFGAKYKDKNPSFEENMQKMPVQRRPELPVISEKPIDWGIRADPLPEGHMPPPGEGRYMKRMSPWGKKEGGLIHGPSGGQKDNVKTSLPLNSFIIPADVVSQLGDGNTLSGGAKLDHMFGGIPDKKHHPRIPAMVSDGEYRISSGAVEALGKGNSAKGAKMLDSLLVNVRKHKAVKKFPPKSKNIHSYMK